MRLNMLSGEKREKQDEPVKKKKKIVKIRKNNTSYYEK
jgi:hypothetical protein